MPDVYAFGRFRQTESNATKILRLHALGLPEQRVRLIVMPSTGFSHGRQHYDRQLLGSNAIGKCIVMEGGVVAQC